ncbi:enolase 4 isoform X2 [Ambystoma mexicanum]|uniref:enolase 4 isoform X2 n=1 Tax=Ambystoma mexicanum TaxID=8296 RepID=UPI0037E90DCE
MNYGGGLSGSCRASREAREFYELKQRAAEFYRANGVPQRLEEALNLVFLQRPEDVYGSLANYFSQFAKTPVLCRMTGRSILDGRGWPVLEVEIFCTVKNNEKSICSSVISSHSELAELALTSVTEAQEKEIRASVEKAKEWINETLNTLLSGLLPSEQLKIDRLLSEYFTKEADEEKERARIEKEERGATEEAPTPVPPPAPVAAPPSGKKKESAKGKKPAPVEKPIPPAEPSEPVLPGSPAIGGVSLAIAKAAAVLNRTPLYMHIASLRYEQLLPKKLIMPLPLISLLSCGKSSPGKLNLMKEVLVLPRSNLTIRQPVPKRASPLGSLVIACDRLEQPLELVQEACKTLGLQLGENLHLAINCAAHELMDYSKGRYDVLSGVSKSPDEMVDMYVDLMNKHPSITAFVDPLRREDAEQWSNLVTVLGSKFNLIAEAASQSVSRLLENRGANTPPSTGVVIRHINQTTVTDLLEIIQLLDERKDMVVLGSTDGESSDDGLVDLAVGLGASFIKLGGLFRGERASKYNRLVTIEEELARSGTLGVRRDTQALHEETPTPATLEAISVKSEDEEKEKEVVVLNTQPLEQD